MFICITALVYIYPYINYAFWEISFLLSSFIGLRKIMINVKINGEQALGGRIILLKCPNTVQYLHATAFMGQLSR